MTPKRYKVVIAQSGKMDVKDKKKHILQQFKYREYAENYSQRVKKAVMKLEVFPAGYEQTGFQYRGYDIYMKPDHNNLLFFTVDEETAVVTVLRVLQDGMDWEYIIRKWLERNNK